MLRVMTAMAPTLSFASAYRQLRPAERAFVDAYVSDCEREAERKGERVSLALHRAIPAETVAASDGMLERPMVTAAIAERIATLAADSELTVRRVVKELMGIAFASIGDYMTIGEDGQPYFDLARCTPEQLAAVQSIDVEEQMTRTGLNRKFKIKLHDKLAGIDKLARYMGILEADNPHWRADQPRNVTPVLPGAITTDGAADRYAAMING
jgi:phage terminase small subunit